MRFIRPSLRRFHTEPQFNLTPMIDVVFLLIIFFMLVCQFIVQENVPVEVPDDCAHVQLPPQHDPQPLCVNVFMDKTKKNYDRNNDQIIIAIRQAQFEVSRITPSLLSEMSDQIEKDIQQSNLPVVEIRADKHLRYRDVQAVLQALAHTSVERIRLAAFQEDQDTPSVTLHEVQP